MDLTKPTFIIGLGGIGHEVVLRVARMFHESTWKGVPDTIRIRSLDTAEQKDVDGRWFKQEYATRLGGFAAGEVISHLDLFPEIKRWWSYNTNLGFIDQGAGAKRPVGRLVVFRDLPKIVAALNSDFQSPLLRSRVEHQAVKNTAHVFIIGSVAGGTGAGMFLDTAILVRHLLWKNGYLPSSIWITGILALPSVIDLQARQAGMAASKQRQLNAFGAMKELDCLMGGWDPSFEMNYPEPVGRFHPAQPIFNSVLLVSATDYKAHIYTDQREILARMARYVYGHVTAESGRVARGILDNIYAQLNPDDRRFGDGQHAIYGTFGVEWLQVPQQYLETHWCSAIGPRVAELVADFEWSRQPKVEMAALVRERLSGDLGSYRRGIVLAASPIAGIDGSTELTGVQAFLDAIGSARKSAELEQTLNEFLNALPSMTVRVQNLRRELPPPEKERKWIMDQVRELVGDKRFRLGGARRFLLETAEQLRQIDQKANSTARTLKEIVAECKSPFFGKINPSRALDFARERLYQQVRTSLQNSLGERAAVLATNCEMWGKRLEMAQRSIRGAVSEFALSQSESSPPVETWLLDAHDIDAALAEKQGEVELEVSETVSQRISKALTDVEPSTEFLEKQLPALFVDEVRLTVRTEAGKWTQRPVDSLDRLKRCVQKCVPMARIHDSGPQFLEIMPESAKPTPIRLVLTGLYGEKLAELKAWQLSMKSSLTAQDDFQIEDSKDPLLDEAVDISIGWPLALFAEIESCVREAKHFEQNIDVFAQHAIMNEFGAAAHSFMPMPVKEVRKLFALAITNGHIGLSSTGDLVCARFEHETFGEGSETNTPTWGEILDAAFRHFRISGFARRYAGFVSRRVKSGREAALDYKEAMSRLLAERRTSLSSARPSPPQEFQTEMLSLFEAAESFIQGIVVL